MYRFLQAGKKLKTLFHKKRTRSFELDFNYLIVRSNDRITFRSSAVQNHKGKSVNKERMALIVLVPIARHRPGTRAEKPQGQQRESSDHHSVTQSILSLSLKGFWCCAEDAVARVTIPCKGIEKVEKFRLFEAEKPRNSKRLARGTSSSVESRSGRGFFDHRSEFSCFYSTSIGWVKNSFQSAFFLGTVKIDIYFRTKRRKTQEKQSADFTIVLYHGND